MPPRAVPLRCLLLLSGCAEVWLRPSTAEAEAEAANAACRGAAVSAAPPGSETLDLNQAVRDDLRRGCMARQGCDRTGIAFG